MGRTLSAAAKGFLFAFAFSTLVVSTFGTPIDKSWEVFKASYKKSYKGVDDERYRRSLFGDNMRFIENHNKRFLEGKHSFVLAPNEFTDWTNDEFTKTMNGLSISLNKTDFKKFSEEQSYLEANLPVEVDWRTKGYVTPVKNQGGCGSCWAFSTTGALEGQHYRKTGKLVSLSEQNLVDCSWSYGNKGCGGGYPSKAMQYIAQNGGVDTEASYPYEGRNGRCRFKPSTVGAVDKGYKAIRPKGSELNLQDAVVNVGPISVCIDASHRSFRFYKQGVYDEPACNAFSLDHAVLAVGYGSEGGVDYWLVKNSWGPGWGERGYVKMVRNKENQCGIASLAVYPIV